MSVGNDVPQFEINGVRFMSTMDAASQLGVKPGTLRAYIKQGVLPEVPMQRVGRKRQRGFTEQYIDLARRTLESDGDGIVGSD